MVRCQWLHIVNIERVTPGTRVSTKMRVLKQDACVFKQDLQPIVVLHKFYYIHSQISMILRVVQFFVFQTFIRTLINNYLILSLIVRDSNSLLYFSQYIRDTIDLFAILEREIVVRDDRLVDAVCLCVLVINCGRKEKYAAGTCMWRKDTGKICHSSRTRW